MITKVTNVDNLISAESGIFNVTPKCAKGNFMCGCQIPLDSASWVRMIFMGCHKELICPGLCLYWWWFWVFAVHCESWCSGIQIKSFTLDHLVTSTWELNSIHFTKLVWLWDVNSNFWDEGSIDCTVDDKVFNISMGAVVCTGVNIINFLSRRQRN